MKTLIERELFDLIQVSDKNEKEEIYIDTDKYISDLEKNRKKRVRYYFNPAQYHGVIMLVIIKTVIECAKEITNCKSAQIIELQPEKWYFEVKA